MTGAGPYSAGEIEAQLDTLLEVEFTFRQTGETAQQLAALPVDEQCFILDWIRRVASTNLELGFQFARRGTIALEVMDREMIEAWALHAMDCYDADGLRPALQVVRQVEGFTRLQHNRLHGAVLEQCDGVLLGFLHGLSGRRLKLAEGESVHTDTETLFLPPIQAGLNSPADNFLLYKVACVYLWAQIRFGTFPALRRVEAPGARFLDLFHGLEALRLEACIARELPGLYREMVRLQGLLGEEGLTPEWEAFRERLADPATSADDVVELARRQLERLTPRPLQDFQGTIDLAAVSACMEARADREKAKFRIALKMLRDEVEKGREAEGREPPRFSKRKVEDLSQPEGHRMEILLDERPVALPEDTGRLASSIILDFGDIPDDYLEPAGAGEYDPALFREERELADDVWSGTYHEEGAFLYPEWDYRRKHYRKSWCAVRERPVTPVHDDFVERTLARYAGLVKHLRKTFEAMRDEDRLLKRQSQGDGVDIDALVEALADLRRGEEMTDRLFTRMHRSERNIAVVFMVDMSGSTKGWINDAERESLVLLCAALESLGDRYAIYGFSSNTRKRCELYPVKRFDEPYSEEIGARIAGIEPKDYTRMGFAIRHLCSLLQESDARTRLLVTLSDGKPDDYDGYRGTYGIEDTRRALIEARRQGIHPYCITIDVEARDYLPHLYGPAAFTVIDEVRDLPLKVSDIYRRLTT